MKNNCKSFIAGMLIGSISFGTLGVYALNKITAYEDGYYMYKFNGKVLDMPKDMTNIVYNDRSYVPVRFITEALGATVNWNEKEKIIDINLPKPEPEKIEVQVPVLVPCEQQDNYRELPVDVEEKDFRFTITGIANDNNETRVFITIENKGIDPIEFNSLDTVLTVGAKDYLAKDVPFSMIDNRWFQHIKEDEKVQGYILFNKIDDGNKNITMNLNFTKNNYKIEKIKKKVQFKY